MSTPAIPKTDPGAALIGVKCAPHYQANLTARAREARAYDELEPYPLYAFRTWKTEDLGPLPRCMPLPRWIATKGARFLFGEGIEISCPGNEDLEKLLRDAWNANGMPSEAVSMAETGAVDGGLALKFSWDPDQIPSLRFQVLNLVDEVRLFYSPHDRKQLLMARIQYRYWNMTANDGSGAYYWYREEWTDTKEVHYLPVAESDMGGGQSGIINPDTYAGWAIDSAASKPNPFGVIPVVGVKNLKSKFGIGKGDLWGLFRILDDLNLAWYQMKRSNQFDSELNPVFIDGELEDDDIDKPVAPGQPISVKSDPSQGNQHQAKVLFPDGGNGLRPALMEYVREMRKLIESAAGTTFVDQAEVTNKGNLTQAVLKQLYATLIETTKEKRKSYGADGIELFLERVALGLQNLGVPGIGKINPKDHDSFDVQIKWPEYFELTDEEKTVIVGRVQEEETAGYTTHERAVETIAQMEGVKDIPALKEELAKEPKPSPTETDPAMGKVGIVQPPQVRESIRV